MLMPASWKLTAKARIAPTAMRIRLVAVVMKILLNDGAWLTTIP
jgi:hypothetical protein